MLKIKACEKNNRRHMFDIPRIIFSHSAEIGQKDHIMDGNLLTFTGKGVSIVDLKWYIVHTYSGFENKVMLNLNERIKKLGQENFFGRIIIPTEKVVELRGGQKKTSSRKFYPGYMLVQMSLNDETWHTVIDIPKVTGFVGGEINPTPISVEEAERIINQMEDGASKPKSKYQFEEGEEIRVVDGPFSNFNGVVREVKPDKEKLRVLITIFGRQTPVELDFIQVHKI